MLLAFLWKHYSFNLLVTTTIQNVFWKESVLQLPFSTCPIHYTLLDLINFILSSKLETIIANDEAGKDRLSMQEMALCQFSASYKAYYCKCLYHGEDESILQEQPNSIYLISQVHIYEKFSIYSASMMS